MAEERRNLKVLMFPYLAYGHITPFLELAKKLSDRAGFSIEFCSTPINLSFIKKKLSDTKYSSSIQLLELHLPELPQLPPHYHTTNGLPPHLIHTLFKALKMAKPQFHQILEAQKPDVLIYDVMQPWAAGIASALGIPTAIFLTSATPMSCYYGHLRFRPGVEFPFPALYLKDHEKPADDGVLAELEEDSHKENQETGMGKMLVNSSRAIEGKYVDYVSELCQEKVVPTGAQIQLDSVDVGHDAGDDHMELFKWLGKQKEHSVVYVSFGSEYLLTKEEMEEVAYGLELSNVPFIWVVRFSKGEGDVNVEDILPEGFLERTGERGRIVEGWSPQARILKHPGIGAFVAHCGWNSILECIEFGVPVIALPKLCDQPFNARLIVEMGIAVEVERDESGKFHRGKLAETIKDVILREKMGEHMRMKVKSVGESVRLIRDEEIDGAVKAVTEVWKKSRSNKALA